MSLRPGPSILAAASFLAAFAAPGAVCNQTVTSTANDGAGTLRNAVAAALPGQFVCIDPSLAGKTITLTSKIALDQDVTILGTTSPLNASVSATSADRVFEIQGTAVVTLTRLVIRDGFIDGSGEGGAGIRVNSGTTLTMNECTVTACVSGSGGAGVRNDGTLTLNRCTVSGNRATGGAGAGVWNTGGGLLTMTNSTVSGNTAVVNGAGIDNDGAGSVAFIHSSTIAYNAAAGDGGGIHAADGDASAVTIEQSIVWGNSAGVGRDVTGTIASADYNMLGTTAGGSFTGTTAHDLAGVDPKLGSLRFNGGGTRTLALLPGSPAIDRIPSASCTQTSDQRLGARPADGDANGVSACDVGAYEASQPLVVTSLADPGGAGTCTLRQALAAASTNTVQGTCVANAFHGSSDVPDRIVFATNGTIHLAAGALTASESVIIDGPGAPSLTIDGGHASTILSFVNGTGANTYVISGVTLANGGAADTDFVGGVSANIGADDSLAIDGCTFRDNVAATYTNLYASGRAVDVARSTFVGSTPSGVTGLAFFNTDAAMTNTTVADTRSAFNAVAVVSNGAGAASTLTLWSSTLSGSEPTGVLVQAQSFASAGSARCRYGGSVVSGHTTQFSNIQGTLTSLGDNVLSDGSGGAPAAGDSTSTDPKLGPLAFNGGPTPTFGLKLGSPAIGRVPIADLAAAVDQRGFLRPFGAAADSGATERMPGGDVDGSGSIDLADVFYLINFLFAGGPPPAGIADPNGDASVDISDVFYLINFLFASGPPPA
jgi:Right handed beta helix region